MPFTFSHPAAVLPLNFFPSKWRSMTGLIIGSIAPDFEKFMRMRAYDNYSHTWESIFYFSLPLSLILAFLFHQLVRNTLIDHLPTVLQKRLVSYKDFNWVQHFKKYYVVIILSILVGALSHILWDAFTHNDGRFVKWIPILKNKIVIGSFSMSVYNFLQMFTSVLGAMIIIIALLILPRYKITEQVPVKAKLKYWIIITVLAFIIVVIRYIFGYHLRYLTNLVVSIIGAGFLSLLITSYLFTKVNAFRRLVYS